MTCGGYSRPMTDLSRGTRARRSGRRPGWLLLTVLLVLAIGASSALVFTSRVELLKLAVILALWAAVVAAFVSVIYRRQSDIDQAKVRDLKLVYDLQLDREISARREYELTVETQLRRELTSEIRAQAADEVAGSAGRAGRAAGQSGDSVRRRPVAPARDRNRSEPRLQRLAARHRIHGPGDRQPDRHRGRRGPRREHRGKPDHRRACRTPSARAPNGRRRRVSAVRTAGRRRRSRRRGAIASRSRRARGHRRHRSRRLNRSRSPHPSPNSLGSHRNRSARPPRLPNRAAADRRAAEQPNRTPEPRPEPEPVAQAPEWQPAPAEGEWIPAGAPGSNWVSPAAPRFVGSADGRERLRRRICRQETGTRAGDDHVDSPAQPATAAARRREPLRAAAIQHRPRPSILGARLRHRLGRRIRGTPAPARARASQRRTAACAAGGAATPQRRGHRRAVGCRAAGQASGHPDRRRPSQAPRRVS